MDEIQAQKLWTSSSMWEDDQMVALPSVGRAQEHPRSDRLSGSDSDAPRKTYCAGAVTSRTTELAYNETLTYSIVHMNGFQSGDETNICSTYHVGGQARHFEGQPRGPTTTASRFMAKIFECVRDGRRGRVEGRRDTDEDGKDRAERTARKPHRRRKIAWKPGSTDAPAAVAPKRVYTQLSRCSATAAGRQPDRARGEP
ncbi:hypothetical protein ONZ51_g8000 [Trametes cubensis]|uniref:Uncharacterized protein n=1 Tax=Trametes cubensis TaxID=1111947 RepID=A0AAD7TP42_9APHY|nr:hypothetical protein ONZ51_g8000 [Trametes cubensis]